MKQSNNKIKTVEILYFPPSPGPRVRKVKRRGEDGASFYQTTPGFIILETNDTTLMPSWNLFLNSSHMWRITFQSSA